MFCDLQILIHDGKKLAKFIACLFLSALTLGLISYFWMDQDLAQFFRREDNGHIWLMARNITDIGLGQHYFIFVFLFLIFIYYIAPKLTWGKSRPERLHWLRAWAWNFVMALCSAGLMLLLSKFLYGRQRPHISEDSDPTNFQFFNHDWDFQSFPSGHTQVLFTVATLLCVLDPKRRILWILLAFLLSFTRVMTYSHFLSDVIGGAFCGIAGSLLGLYLMNRYSRFQVFKK